MTATALVAALVLAEYTGPIVAMGFAIVSTAFAALAAPDRLSLRSAPAPVVWLVGIFAIGCISAVVTNILGHPTSSLDIQRDLGIIGSYGLFLVVGHALSERKQTYILLLSCILVVGLIVSLVQLVRFADVLATGVSDLYAFRLEAGRGSTTQFAALCSAYLIFGATSATRIRRLVFITSVVVTLSIVVTLSRGLMLFLVVLLLGVGALRVARSGGLRPNPRRAVLLVIATTVAVSLVYASLGFLSPSTQHFIDSSFLSRLGNSANEVAATRLQSRNQIIENYRAFELDKTLSQVSSQPPYARLLGQGWGISVEFNFDTAARSSAFRRTSVAFLHNGYAYFLLKTGLVGLFLYIAFMVHLLVAAASTSSWYGAAFSEQKRKILVVISLCIALGTVTTGGLGFPTGYLGLVLVAGACCRQGPMRREPPAGRTAPTATADLRPVPRRARLGS